MKNNKIMIVFSIIIIALCIAVLIVLRNASNKKIDNPPTYSQSAVVTYIE